MQKAVARPIGSARPLSLGWISRIFPHLVLLFLTFTSIMPFVWMFFGSFKTYVEITDSFARWSTVDIRYRGKVLRFVMEPA